MPHCGLIIDVFIFGISDKGEKKLCVNTNTYVYVTIVWRVRLFFPGNVV